MSGRPTRSRGICQVWTLSTDRRSDHYQWRPIVDGQGLLGDSLGRKRCDNAMVSDSFDSLGLIQERKATIDPDPAKNGAMSTLQSKPCYTKSFALSQSCAGFFVWRNENSSCQDLPILHLVQTLQLHHFVLGDREQTELGPLVFVLKVSPVFQCCLPLNFLFLFQSTQLLSSLSKRIRVHLILLRFVLFLPFGIIVLQLCFQFQDFGA